MNFDPALNGLLDLLAEAVMRKLETQTPAELGDPNDVPTVNGVSHDDKQNGTDGWCR